MIRYKISIDNLLNLALLFSLVVFILGFIISKSKNVQTASPEELILIKNQKIKARAFSSVEPLEQVAVSGEPAQTTKVDAVVPSQNKPNVSMAQKSIQPTKRVAYNTNGPTHLTGLLGNLGRLTTSTLDL